MLTRHSAVSVHIIRSLAKSKMPRRLPRGLWTHPEDEQHVPAIHVSPPLLPHLRISSATLFSFVTGTVLASTGELEYSASQESSDPSDSGADDSGGVGVVGLP